MNRRVFVSAAATVAFAQPPRLRIAFLGAAHVHTPGKVPVVRALPEYELAGMVEDDPAIRAPYEKAGIPILPLDRVLHDESIRVIAVDSAVADHARHARMALEAGKHVHVEKPPATNLADFRALVDLALRKRLLMQMGYMWRYNPAINAALDAARNGTLGDVFMVRANINTLLTPEQRAPLVPFRGGQMFELGCHLIDPIVRLLGRPEKVAPFLRRSGRYDDTLNDNCIAVFEYPRALAVVSSATLQPDAGPHRALEIMGTGGTAVVSPIEPPALRIRTRGVPMPPYRRYVDDFKDLAAAIAEGRPLAITPQQDLLVQETLLRACEMLS